MPPGAVACAWEPGGADDGYGAAAARRAAGPAVGTGRPGRRGDRPPVRPGREVDGPGPVPRQPRPTGALLRPRRSASSSRTAPAALARTGRRARRAEWTLPPQRRLPRTRRGVRPLQADHGVVPRRPGAAQLREGALYFVVAIWIRLPQVSSNTAVVTGPASSGACVKRTPSARSRSCSAFTSSTPKEVN